LSSELTTSKKSSGTDPTTSAAIKQKDKELRDLKKQLSDLSQVVSNAKRDQRVREHDLAKSMALREEIEQYKKEKVALEKKQREDAKKYAEERRERELERARALKRERQMQLELQKKDEQIHKQMAALATHRQRERKYVPFFHAVEGFPPTNVHESVCCWRTGRWNWRIVTVGRKSRLNRCVVGEANPQRTHRRVPGTGYSHSMGTQLWCLFGAVTFVLILLAHSPILRRALSQPQLVAKDTIKDDADVRAPVHRKRVIVPFIVALCLFSNVQEALVLIKDAIAAGDQLVDLDTAMPWHNTDTRDIRVAQTFGEAAQTKICASAERFCSEAVRKCIG
jgi:hypothetical protein